MTKREAFEKALAYYYEVRVVVAPHASLVLPADILPRPGEAGIVLVYGLDMPKPIEDLTIDDTGILATLSFGGLGWHKTFVPWDAVLGLRCKGQRSKQKPQLRSV